MELYPKQYEDLCEHESDAYAGTIYNGDQLVDVYFLYGRNDRRDVGVCIRESDECPSNYVSGSVDSYIRQLSYGDEGIPLDPEGMYKAISKLKYIRRNEQFRLNVLSLFFKWAAERSLMIDPKLIHRESTFSKSIELYEYEYKKANEDRDTTTNRDLVA